MTGLSTRCALGPLLFLLLSTGMLSAQNLIHNGDLEGVNHAPWSHPLYGANVVTMGQLSGAGVGESKCLFIEGKVPRGNRFWFQDVTTVSPGSQVRLTVMVRTEGVSGLVWLAMGAKQGLRRSLAYATTRTRDRITGTSDWRQISLQMEVPAGTDKVVVYAYLQGRGRAYFDDFLLRALGGGAAAKGGAKAKGGEKEAPEPETAVYLLRAEVEVAAERGEKNGKLYVHLPVGEETQQPYYFKTECFPADGIDKMTVERKGGRDAPPYLEIRLKGLESGEKVKIRMESKVLVLPREKHPELPAKLPDKVRMPPGCKAYLPLSPILEEVAAPGQEVLKAFDEKAPPASLLAALVEAAGGTGRPALALAYALRSRKVPARLLCGALPGNGAAVPVLALDAWIAGAGWVRIEPRRGLVFPPPARFILIRPLDRRCERRFSRFIPSLPESSFIDARGRIRITGTGKEPGKPLECSRALPVATPKPELRVRLVQALEKNWDKWLESMEKGRGDQKAAWAGQTAAQTDDFEEVLRILQGI